MKSVYINRSSVVTALGDNLEASWAGLMTGKSGIAPITRFDTSNYITSLGAEIGDLEKGKSGTRIFPLLDRLLENFGFLPADTVLILATTKACIDILEDHCRVNIGQTLDYETARKVSALSILQYLKKRFGLFESGYNVNAACASSTIALARGAEIIRSGLAKRVMVVGLDIVSEFVFSGFSALRALSAYPARPFDAERDGLSLGDGAVAILLGDKPADDESGQGELVGWGSALDANHITAPARDGCGLIDSIRFALRNADLEPGAIAAISAHGTGTVYNDLMEIKAFREVFGTDSIPPLNSIKGAVGHTLGGAGGIEATVALKSLHEGKFPSTTGLKVPDPEPGNTVSNECKTLKGQYVLSTNSGFGGVNASLIIRRLT